MVASLTAVFAVLAVEGPVWMERHGVFMLDGDPPRHAVGVTDLVLDLFTTGLWIPHLVFWAPWVAWARRWAPCENRTHGPKGGRGDRPGRPARP